MRRIFTILVAVVLAAIVSSATVSARPQPAETATPSTTQESSFSNQLSSPNILPSSEVSDQQAPSQQAALSAPAATSCPFDPSDPSAPGPYNSRVNCDPYDSKSIQDETTVAVSSVNSPGTTVMVGYNDFKPGSGVGYSYSYDGGTRWQDGGGLPVFRSSTGVLGRNVGDPALTVDKNGTFYFAFVAKDDAGKMFIALTQCPDSPSIGVSCKRPQRVSDAVTFSNKTPVAANDKPWIAYDPTNNRVYVTWTRFGNDSTGDYAIIKLRYWDVNLQRFSTTYDLHKAPPSVNGSYPVVKSNGTVYTFFEANRTSATSRSIRYVSLTKNGTKSNPITLASFSPAGDKTTCDNPEDQPGPIEDFALRTQAFDTTHAAGTTEFPTAVVDSSGNIHVVWNARPPSGGGTGPSVIWVATLPSSGGTPYIRRLPNKNDSTSTRLIQLQPTIAFAGGSNKLAISYYQVVQLADGKYWLERDQVAAPASATPAFVGTPSLISTKRWKPPQTNPNFDSFDGGRACYMGDYTASTSLATSNTVWTYWGDHRNLATGPFGYTGPQPDIYGLFYTP